MRTKDLLALKPGSHVEHTRYGKSAVVEVKTCLGGGSFFGLVINPLTDRGRSMLREDARIGTDMPLLESSPRRLKQQKKANS